MEQEIILVAQDSMGVIHAEVSFSKEVRPNPVTEEEDIWYLITGGHHYDFESAIALRELPIGSTCGVVLPENRMETPAWRISK